MFLPVIIPLLPEGDLDTELHPDIVNLLEAPDKEVDPDEGGAVALVPGVDTPGPRYTSYAHVYSLALILQTILK